ncbi:helix-turn-helix domain-containing protein [Mobiluncus mulieris]|nr:helix-turn-helix transcriptional regulator [Mobiluncus mulieris]
MKQNFSKNDGDIFTAMVAAEVKGVMATRGLTIAKVAAELGHAASVMSNWLNGKRALPISVAMRICDLADTPLAVVVDRAWQRFLREYPELLPDGYSPGDTYTQNIDVAARDEDA